MLNIMIAFDKDHMLLNVVLLVYYETAFTTFSYDALTQIAAKQALPMMTHGTQLASESHLFTHL